MGELPYILSDDLLSNQNVSRIDIFYFSLDTENSKCDYVLFQAATTIKESVVREWTLLETSDIESLRSFLLRFITQHIT